MTFEQGASEAAAGAECILVAEGEVLVRMMIAQYLRDCGYKVIEAASTDEAVTVLDHQDLAVDIVLSDVEMPGRLDGFGLARWVRQHRPGLHMILVGTPMRAADIAGELCESGPMVTKPYEPKVVVDRIRRLMGERASRT